MKYIRPPSLDVTDANAGPTDVKSPKTFYSGIPEKQVGTLLTKELDPASSIVAEGFYAATNLVTVDPDLATGNIKNGIVVFGVSGSTNVRDSTDADAIVGDVKTGKTFYAGGGAKKTGTLPTQTLNPANSTVQAGYYAATTLEAVDADLASANIKSGKTIFGKAGAATVQDIADADALVSDVVPPKTFYSVTGAKKTGTHVCSDPAVDQLTGGGELAYDSDSISGRHSIPYTDLEIGEDVTFCSYDLPAVAEGSIVFASGGGRIMISHSDDNNKGKRQLLIGGVQVAQSAYMTSAGVTGPVPAMEIGYREGMSAGIVAILYRVHAYAAFSSARQGVWYIAVSSAFSATK